MDIRDQSTLDHDDVTALSFIRRDPPFVFRRHHRHGLRSHIMEILAPDDVQREHNGILADGITWFPRARPRRMLRIFRTRLESLDQALREIGRVKIVERYLAPDFMATSTECVVQYRKPDGDDIVLCGFQAYVPGEIIDPWTLLDAQDLLPSLFDTLETVIGKPSMPFAEWMASVRRQGGRFVEKIKRMVLHAGHIPDLAGAGNLIVTPCGGIRLVDINNISPIGIDEAVGLDEKGYPVGDKSIEALRLIESKITGRTVDRSDPFYGQFLTTRRRQRVEACEKAFWEKTGGRRR